MNYHNELIKISDFSKLCGVSKQTLIYYDKIGLFSPHFVNEKGYRFYTLEQFSLLGLIKTLKDLETPLEEIKIYINNKNSENFMELLKRKKNQLEEKISSLKSISKAIDKGMDILDEGRSNLAQVGRCQIELHEMEYISVSSLPGCKDSFNFVKSINELNRIAEDLRIKMPNIHGLVKKAALKDLNESFDIDALYIKNESMNKESVIKPKGRYAVIYHQGTFDETYKSYKKLLSFIKDEGYQIQGDSYEETLLDIKTENNDIFLIKLSIFIGG